MCVFAFALVLNDVMNVYSVYMDRANFMCLISGTVYQGRYMDGQCKSGFMVSNSKHLAMVSWYV